MKLIIQWRFWIRNGKGYMTNGFLVAASPSLKEYLEDLYVSGKDIKSYHMGEGKDTDKAVVTFHEYPPLIYQEIQWTQKMMDKARFSFPKDLFEMRFTPMFKK